MKIVILAGGLGTRISEYTKTIPKPMIKINNKPLILLIMQHYAKYGYKDFYIALGYKGNVIKSYFKKRKFKWKVNLVDTGKNTMTGGRLKRLKKYMNNERFMMTYGDGVSNVDIKKLLNFHSKSKRHATLTAVRPPARFGAIKIKSKFVTYFKEKSKLDEGWINGGFFVFEPTIFELIKGDRTYLEKEPLNTLSRRKQLIAYKHEGFWECMDTKRDRDRLNKIINKIKF